MKKFFEKFELLLTRKKEFIHNLENISKILEIGSNEEKIKTLEILDDINDSDILQKIISKLDDDSIQVRGEAFSALVLNKNKISNLLIQNLNSPSKNIRAFAALVLANRNEIIAIPEIKRLTKDDHGMVRSCAIGALGHLKDQESKEIFLESVLDSNLEVKKSALQAIIDLNIAVSDDVKSKIAEEKDSETEKLLSQLEKSGPEGI